MRIGVTLRAISRRTRALLALVLTVICATPGLADIVTLGAPVFDTDGNPIGTVVHIEGDLATIDTGTAKVTLTLWSFAMRSKGLIVAMNRAALEASAARIEAEAERDIIALLKPGTPVHGPDGEVAARVDHIEGRAVVFRISGGEIRLDISALKRSAKRLESRYDRAALEAIVRARNPGNSRLTGKI